jgi:hypothetical protein
LNEIIPEQNKLMGEIKEQNLIIMKKNLEQVKRVEKILENQNKLEEKIKGLSRKFDLVVPKLEEEEEIYKMLEKVDYDLKSKFEIKYKKLSEEIQKDKLNREKEKNYSPSNKHGLGRLELQYEEYLSKTEKYIENSIDRVKRMENIVDNN